MISAAHRFVWTKHNRERVLNITHVNDESNRSIAKFQLHERLILQRKHAATNDGGDLTPQNALVTDDNPDGRFFGYVEAIGGGEKFRGLQTQESTQFMVVVANPNRRDEALICECQEEG